MFLFLNNVIIILCCLNKHRINNISMHQYSVFNSVYYPKERENDTINEIYSDLRHVTIAQHLGGGVDVWLVITYNVALFYYCFAVFSR